jgi:hypothetical protein
MGHFNDLPKDVVWLILRDAFISLRIETFSVIYCLLPLEFLQDKELRLTNDVGTTFEKYTIWMRELALINVTCLSVIRSKTTKVVAKNVWMFNKGSLTDVK